MATSQTSFASHELSITVRLFEVLGFVATSVRQFYDYSRTVKALTKLTARELDDLGLDSRNVKAAAHKVVYGV